MRVRVFELIVRVFELRVCVFELRVRGKKHLHTEYYTWLQTMYLHLLVTMYLHTEYCSRIAQLLPLRYSTALFAHSQSTSFTSFIACFEQTPLLQNEALEIFYLNVRRVFTGSGYNRGCVWVRVFVGVFFMLCARARALAR